MATFTVVFSLLILLGIVVVGCLSIIALADDDKKTRREAIKAIVELIKSIFGK